MKVSIKANLATANKLPTWGIHLVKVQGPDNAKEIALVTSYAAIFFSKDHVAHCTRQFFDEYYTVLGHLEEDEEVILRGGQTYPRSFDYCEGSGSTSSMAKEQSESSEEGW